ncbi:LapA family protein [candidate division KSB1 bacterium]|nr:LapA family protein [candidate division KSB1 bacterium]
MKPKTIVIIVVGVLFAIILFQNMGDVEFKVLFWEPLEMPKLILVLSSVFLGWVMGWLTHMAYQKGKKKAAKASPDPEPQEENTDKETPAGTETNP